MSKRILLLWSVECKEGDCGWVYSNYVKSDVEAQARYHRDAHERREQAREQR